MIYIYTDMYIYIYNFELHKLFTMIYIYFKTININYQSLDGNQYGILSES